MYKTLNFALLSILLISIPSALFSGNQAVEGSHAAILNISPQSITLGFELSDVENATVFNDNQTFSRCIIKDEGLTYEHGMPLLPAVTRMVVVPPEAGLELVVRAGEPRSVDTDSPPEIFTDEAIAVAFDENLPHQHGIYPPVVAEMSDPFVIRGARIVRVTTYPVRYDFDNDVYLHYDSIETEIVYTNDQPVNPSLVPQRRNRSPEFLKFINDFAINGDMVGRDDPDRDREPEYVGHYLVVTHENCLQYAAEFLEWRRQSGWKVDILSVSSNDARTPSTVKEMIQERYDEYLDNEIDPFDQVFLIGDHADYGGAGPGSGWVLESDRGNSCWPHNCNHNDWYYACLEGDRDDYAADVGIARWIAGSRQIMELFVLRTMSYEVEPYMEDTDWFTRGAAYAERWGGNYHFSLATNVRYAKSVFESLGWDDVRTHEEMDANNQSVGPFITRQFNDGVNVMAGRAENYYYRNGFVGVNESEIFPIDLDVAGHHEWSCWHMMRTSTPEHPKGPAAASTGWGGQQTLPFSVVWLEIVNGFLQRDLTFGWAHVKGLLGPEIYIPGWNNTYGTQCRTDVVFYGDPAIQFWRGVPQVIEADYKETISPKDHLFEVCVTDAENDQNVAGARVTIYIPGEMPDPDNDDYADYDGMFMLTTLTDDEGIGRFVLPQDNEFEPGPMHVTVTGRDILPNRGVVDIEQPETGIELVESTFEQIAGNDDDNVNPGERFFLNLTARNLSGDDAVPNVEATVMEMSPYLDVLGDDEIEFGTIAAGNEVEGREGVEIAIAPDCPDGASRPITRPSLKIVFRSGERSWETAILLDPYAPNMAVKEVVGDGIISYDIEPLNIEIENIGRLTSTDLTATMITMGMGVSVVDEEAHYPALHPGESARFAGAPPRVMGNRLVVPGSKYGMALMFENEGGFVDSAFFEVQVSEERENAPQGPDAYGYICFDDTDSTWDVAPVYEWIEISARDDDRRYDGEELDFDGSSHNDIGETIVVDLPFETQFYGHIYDQITVATNGFISMGDQEYVTNYQNWPMDRCQGGGVGMLAPLWDDLRLPNEGGIYCFYDEENSAFIVEWYRMRHRNGGNTDLIFQVRLYDRAVWITETGDQNILFQYKSVSNVRGRGDWAQNASPYASVGISSPDGDSGINYTFNNVYPVTSARLENHRAIFFATSPRYKSGTLYGRVTCFETGQPLEGAVISTQHGFMAITDENGLWRINDALADIEFSLTCLKEGYNDSTKYNLIVQEDSELEINFELLHPEFHPSTWRMTQLLDPELTVILPYNVHNQGNGPLDWEMTRRLPGNAEVPPWELRTNYPASVTVEDTRLEGVVYINDMFYISGANMWERDDGPNMIYVLNHEGELVREFEQPGESHYGMRDLAWDGELIWGSGADSVYGFTPDGEQVRSFMGPYDTNSSLAWDSDREVLWVAGRVSNEIVAYTRFGEEADLRIPRFGLRLYGLAYWPGDPDGYPLYVFHSPDNLSQIIYKIDPDAPDTMFVAQLETEEGGTPAGAFATNTFDVYSWVFIGITNDAGEDRIDIWQIDARRDWFRVFTGEGEDRIEITEGRIDATEIQDFELQLSSVDLPLETFEGMLTYYHNAVGTPSVIDVTLRVIGPMRPQPFGLMYPTDNDTLDANIDNTEVTFRWEESIDNNYYDVVSYKIWFESCGERAMMEADACSLTVDMGDIAGNLGLSIEVEFPMFWWVWAYSGEDSIDCHRRFSFTFLPNYISDSGENAPVEFGLHSIYPSPFNSSTTIRFGVDKRERFRLCIYDLTGRRIATLLDGMPEVGYHNLVWNAAALPSGMYIVHLETADRSQIRKAVLVR